MATQSPFSLFEGLLQGAAAVKPPQWAIDETQHRLVLLLNHVLMQEPQATERLKRQAGRVVLARWRDFALAVRVTPAGLFEAADSAAVPDLSFSITEQSPLQLAQSLMGGAKPPVHIEGDVQLAAEVNWLVDHVRWDIEEDLSKLMGDVPAHTLMQGARAMAEALLRFISPRATPPGDGTAA